MHRSIPASARRLITASAACVLIGSAAGDSRPRVTHPPGGIWALAPVENQASGLVRPAGIAADGASAVVTDRALGTLARIDRSGRRRVVLGGLDRPGGVAIDPEGNILVIEDGTHRLLRIDRSGLVATMASELTPPA